MKPSMIIILLYTFSSVLYGEVTWRTTYGEPLWDQIPAGMIPQCDGSMIVVGTTYSSTADSGDICILKISSSGVIKWAKTYGGIGLDTANSVLALQDSTLFVFGNTSSRGAGLLDYWLLKINTSGDTLWTRTYGDSSMKELPARLMIHPDGSIFMAGLTQTPNGTDCIYVVKADASGKLLWKKKYAWNNNCSDVYGTAVKANGSIVILASTGTCGIGSQSLRFLNLNSESGDTIAIPTAGSGKFVKDGSFLQQPDASTLVLGNVEGTFQLSKFDTENHILWTKQYGTQYADIFNVMTIQDDGSIMIAGTTLTGVFGTERIFIVKADSDGDTVWTRKYGRPFGSFPANLFPQSDGSLLILGTDRLSDSTPRMTALLKINQSGDTLWTKTIGDTHDLLPKQIVTRPDGSVVILATVSSDSGSNIALFSLQLPEPITPALFLPAKRTEVHFNFRRISRSSYFFSLPSDALSLTIFNSCGQCVRNWAKTGANVQWNGENIQGNLVPPGCYFARIGVKGNFVTRQLTVLR